MERCEGLGSRDWLWYSELPNLVGFKSGAVLSTDVKTGVF